MSHARRNLSATPLAIRLPAILPALIAVAALVATASGCRQPVAAPASVVLDFDAQRAAVRTGTSDTIQLTDRPLNDQQLDQLEELPLLRQLLIDSSLSPQSDFAKLADLPLEHLRIRNTAVSDQQLSELAEMSGRLRILNLPHSQLSDQGMLWIAGHLPSLEQLRIGSSRLTNVALQHIATHPKLRSLHLIGAPVSDEGLVHLATMTSLESLYLDRSQVQGPGLATLARLRQERSLPPLHIHLDQKHHDLDPHKH